MGSSQQLLLYAEPLMRQALARLLEASEPNWTVLTDSTALKGRPDLVIWSLDQGSDLSNVRLEVLKLQDRWQPAPLLLVTPSLGRSSRQPWLDLSVQGILEQPLPEQLCAAITTLLSGGRVVELGAEPLEALPSEPLGLGQWLLLSGLQQIDGERQRCLAQLEPPPEHPLAQLMLEGRLRELTAARGFLLWLWGPAQLAWSVPLSEPISTPPLPSPGTAITLSRRNADGVWQTIRERLEQALAAGVGNRSGQLLALEGLSPDHRRELLLVLLQQLSVLRQQMLEHNLTGAELEQRWSELQPELRRQALRTLAGSYVQLPFQGQLRPVAEALVTASDLGGEDPELPPPLPMLASLLHGQPLLVEGRLLAPDEPMALLRLEALVSNWLVRNAEQVSAEVLSCCAPWPELRRYLLCGDLLATRNLERLRNRLNAQQRWASWFERPVQLYESRRALLHLQAGAIASQELTDPRDQELLRLGGLQQLVTLALEARDAIGPQLQLILKNLGDAVVVVLTQVIGRAIGLVGRGIVQGMGKSFGRP
ncbi:MAG: DUF3685 domain-containing protein [Prochlorococcaceae cyanobacterium]